MRISVTIVILICLWSIVQAKNPWTTLFPSSPYSRALEVCMRVLDDMPELYDVITAEDLCVGRFVRLLQEVSSVEYVHTHCSPYPPEDIEYIAGLVERITQEKQAQINSSRAMRFLIRSIHVKLAQLLAH